MLLDVAKPLRQFPGCYEVKHRNSLFTSCCQPVHAARRVCIVLVLVMVTIVVVARTFRCRIVLVIGRGRRHCAIGIGVLGGRVSFRFAMVVLATIISSMMADATCTRQQRSVTIGIERRKFRHERDNRPDIFIVMGGAPRRHARHLDAVLGDPEQLRWCHVNHGLREVRSRRIEALSNCGRFLPRGTMTRDAHRVKIADSRAYQDIVREIGDQNFTCAAADRLP